jgi:16S rRNA (cytidine1402-2'-O)-methyltransferase
MASALKEVGALPYSLVIFESPRRVGATLRVIGEALGQRDVVVMRELSKLHEQTYRGAVSEVGRELGKQEPMGEFTIVVGPGQEQALAPTDKEIAGALGRLSEKGETGRDAVRIVSAALDVPRSAVYRVWLSVSKRAP